MKTIKFGKVEWIHIEKPGKKDIEFLKKNFGFHPIILDELLQLSTRSRVEKYDSYIYMPYHFPVYDSASKTSRRAEIDFIAVKNSIITIDYEPLDVVQNTSNAIQNNISMQNRIAKEGPGLLVYYILQEIINFSMRQLRHVQEKIELINANLFKGQEDKLLESVSRLKSEMLEYQIITRPQQIILESLRETGEKFWGSKMKIYLADLSGDFMKIIQLVELHKEAIDGLEETNSQLLNVKTNRVMQKFTILAFLTFPLMLLTGIFNVEIVANAAFSRAIDFWIVFGATTVFVVGLWAYFRKKEWL